MIRVYLLNLIDVYQLTDTPHKVRIRYRAPMENMDGFFNKNDFSMTQS